VSSLEWWDFAVISKPEFGLRMIISASDPGLCRMSVSLIDFTLN